MSASKTIGEINGKILYHIAGPRDRPIYIQSVIDLRGALPHTLDKFMNFGSLSDLDDIRSDENQLSDLEDDIRSNENQQLNECSKKVSGPDLEQDEVNAYTPSSKSKLSVKKQFEKCPVCGLQFAGIEELQIHTNDCLDSTEENEVPKKIFKESIVFESLCKELQHMSSVFLEQPEKVTFQSEIEKLLFGHIKKNQTVFS